MSLRYDVGMKSLFHQRNKRIPFIFIICHKFYKYYESLSDFINNTIQQKLFFEYKNMNNRFL